jgi:Carboxypeptidase regulatory-like domain
MSDTGFYLMSTLLLFYLTSATAEAQATGELKGMVQDPSGAGVPAARLKLQYRTTGEEFKATSDDAGQFEFTQLPVGRYFLSVKARGFEDSDLPVSVRATPAAPIQVRLEVAEEATRVDVTAQLPSAPSVQENLDAIQLDRGWLQNLPLKEHDPLAVATLFNDPATDRVAGPKIIVDGMESDTLDLPVTAIKSISVNQNPYSAEWARPGKGRLEVTTRKGSGHRYAGLLMYSLDNWRIDARDTFASSRPPKQHGVFEGQLDGPLTKKLKFFVAAQHFVYNDSSTVTAETPDGPLRQNFGFSTRRTNLFGRLDYRSSPTNKFIFRYRLKDLSQRNKGVGGFNLPERAFDTLKMEHHFYFSELTTLSPAFSTELRLKAEHTSDQDRSHSEQPAIVVLGAFSRGGAQTSKHIRENGGEVEDVATYIRGTHTMRFGAGLRPRVFGTYNAANFGGTFTFSSLASLAAGHPEVFSVNEGSPKVYYHREEFYSFFQDEMRLGSNLSLLMGLRYELQSNVSHYINFAPRLGFAYAPGGRRTVVRGGAGIFYDRQPPEMQLQSALYDERHLRGVVISEPGFPSPLSGGLISSEPPSIWRISPDIRLPYFIQTSFGVERKLGNGNHSLTVEYSRLRGVGLFRVRNINAPLPGTLVRPNPDFINIDQFESTATSTGHSLAITFKSRLGKGIGLMAQYTLSRTVDDSGGLGNLGLLDIGGTSSLPSDNYNLRADRGRADFDRRHRLNAAGSYNLPKGIRLGTILSITSGMPFNIITGTDDNHDTVVNDRPPGVGRNTGKGPGYFDLDVHVARQFLYRGDTSKANMEISWDAFNVLNHVNYMNFNGVRTSPFFGQANDSFPARTMQVQLKIRF